MTSRLEVQTNKFMELEENLYVKYYNDTWINKLSLSLLFNVWKDMKKTDAIHLQGIFSTPTPIVLFYNLFIKRPLLLSPRGSFAPWILGKGKKSKILWLKYFIKPFSKNIYWHATADQEKNEILDLFPEAKVFIVPNGINLDEYVKTNKLSKNEYMKQYTGKDITPEFILISMGRLHAKKGFDILIDTFAALEKQSENSVLLIAGDDETEQSNLETQISDLGLKERVFLIGSVSGQEKVDFLANADLFVLPSHNENFGNVYVESMAAGTPIVASKNTPWKEVKDANCGQWVENTVDETKNSIMEMLEKDREEMRINSKSLANKYEWTNVASEFKQIFETIIDQQERDK